jgi:hypothetical protein
MLLIPFISAPSNSFVVQLGNGIKYEFTTRYNDVGGFWTIDITRKIDGVVLVVGVPVLLGQDLLPYGLGIGRLIAIDESGADVDAGPEDLGDRVNVYWFADGELEAAAAAAA